MAARLDVNVKLARQPRENGRVQPESPMRLLVIGDFSALGANGPRPAREWQAPFRLSGEHVDELMQRLAPRLSFRHGDAAGELRFSEIDHFHPDSLYRRLDVFAELRDLRTRLLNPTTFDSAARQLRERLTGPGQEPEGSAGENADKAFARVLGFSPRDTSSHQPSRGAVDQLLRTIVGPHVVPGASPNAHMYVESLDAAIAEQMRAVVHEPRFQGLEARWLALRRLLLNEDLTDDVSVWVLDLDLDSLRENVRTSGSEPRDSDFGRLIAERNDSDQGWSAIVADFYFEATVEDLEMVAALGVIAAEAGGPLLASVRPRVIGCESLAASPDHSTWNAVEADVAEAWAALRNSPCAEWVGLSAQRLLQRMPYGPRADRIESFPFDEIGPAGDHESLPWSNAAFGCAMLLARAYTQPGWSMSAGHILELDGLPAATRIVDGEASLIPCAEAFINERTSREMLARGLMPLLSYRDRGSVRLVRFQSVADPPAVLAGRWEM